jgi:hypothetical protein
MAREPNVRIEIEAGKFNEPRTDHEDACNQATTFTMPHSTLVKRKIPPQPINNPITKPLYHIGSYVCAAWWPSPDRRSNIEYYHGVVKNYALKKDADHGYGPLILYDVLFDDDTVACGVEDCYVYLTEDYENLDQVWKGVDAACDEKSKDRWAKEIGWYVATIDGVDRSYPRLMDAVRAYDRAVVQKKGPQTVAADLNLPDEWDWLLPR